MSDMKQMMQKMMEKEGGDDKRMADKMYGKEM